MSFMGRFFHVSKRTLGVAAAGCLLTLGANATQYSASFKGTDINEFINTVGKSLKKTIIIDQSVRGKINVRSYETLTEEQYYDFFLNVLEVYGFAVVEVDDNILKVIKSKNAKFAAIPVVDDGAPGQGDEMVTRIVPVHNVSVRELAPLLRQLVETAAGGNVVAYEPSNVIMLTGRAAVVKRIVELVRRVDKQGDQEVDIVSLKYGSAPEMVRIVEAISKQTAGKGGKGNVLEPKVVADERTNSVVVSGDSKARERVVRLLRRLDNEQETTGNTKVVHLKYAQAKELVTVLSGVAESIESEGQTKTKSRRSNARQIDIQAHEDSNSLVITAQPDMMRSLEQVIRQLDVRRAQVNVEAIIVEMSEGDGINLGVQLGHASGGIIQFNDGTGVPISSVAAGVEAAQSTTTPGTTVTTENGTTVNPDITTDGDFTQLASALAGVNGTMVGLVEGDWAALVQAVSTDSNSNILATPHLTTLDNHEATFVVGEEVPVITGSTSSSNNTNPFQTVDRKEVGIKLTVTPQINEGDAVQLTINQEVSGINGGTAVDVKFSKREVNTTVMANDGQIIVIGGLIDEDVQESVSKVPLLGDIPVLGHLFRSTSSRIAKRNLMVFIRPTIIRDEATMTQVSSRKYNLIRAAQLAQQEQGIELMPNTKTDILPEFNEKMKLPAEVKEYLEQESGSGNDG